MKTKSIILFTVLTMSIYHGFCQTVTDSVPYPVLYNEFNDFITYEESWKIQHEALRKQLEALDLNKEEINDRMAEFEKQKDQFMKNLEAQLKEAQIQAEQAEQFRIQAEELRKQAELHQQNAEQQQEEYEIKRKQYEEQLNQVTLQNQQTLELRNLSEWNKGFQSLLNSEIFINSDELTVKPLKIEVKSKNNLYFSINSSISSGTIRIEIFDPSGKSEGTLTLENRRKPGFGEPLTSLFKTSGTLIKTINSPVNGVWSIEISPKDAGGNVSLLVGQSK